MGMVSNWYIIIVMKVGKEPKIPNTEKEEDEENGWAELGSGTESLRPAVELFNNEVIDMTNCREGILTDEFPSGVYMYHGSIPSRVEGIFETGFIMNARGVYENKLKVGKDELEAGEKSEEDLKEKLREISNARHSGYEGISWSVNNIEALPGEKGHIVGFIAAPESVLGTDKLVMPTMPAPYELLQVSDSMNVLKFFEAKKQCAVWGDSRGYSFENASIVSGLLWVYVHIRNNKYASLLCDFAERGGLPAEKLRMYYTIESGRVKIADVLQHQRLELNENYLPPAAVFIQYMIDAGLFKGTVADGLGVNEIIEEATEDNELLSDIMAQARQYSDIYVNEYQAELDKIDDVSVRVEDTYLVTSHLDLGGWQKVIERSGHKPRGILLYDDEKVVEENFINIKSNSNIELSREIGRAVGVDEGFWLNKMGIDIEKAPRAGSQGHALDESVVNYGREIHVKDGKIVVEDIRR